MCRMYPKELENGDFPLLNSSDRNLLNEIYFEAKKEIENKYSSVPDDDDPNDNDPDDDAEKIEIILDNLRRIIKHLKLCSEAKRSFIDGFPKWRKVRDQTVESLLSLGESLHLDRKIVNISKLVGNVTSFCGGATCLISAALMPFTFGISTPFVIAGGIIPTLLGTGTSAGAAITEMVLLSNKIKNANTIINEDKESSEDLSSWLVHSCELSKALEFIKNIDVMSDIMKTIQKSFLDPLKPENVFQRKTLVKNVVAACLKLFPLAFKATKVICNVIETFSTLIYMLVTITLLYNRNRVVFECASLTFKCVVAGLSVVDSSIDAATVAVSLISGETTVAKSVGAAVARGTFAALTMTIDVISVVLTSIDVHNGSKSQEGQKIIDAANKLKEERDILQKVFDDITHF